MNKQPHTEQVQLIGISFALKRKKMMMIPILLILQWILTLNGMD